MAIVAAVLAMGTGHWLDISTIVVALLFARFQRARTPPGHRPAPISIESANEVASGMAVFPLLLVMFSSISEEALKALAGTNRIIMFIAGLFAIAAILENRKPDTRRAARSRD